MKVSITDKTSGYGLISILLHWLTAGVVLLLWFLGDSLQALSAVADRFAQLQLHISIALSAYVLLVLRIGWRLRSGHPRVAQQANWSHRLAKFTHYCLLVAIATMLVSGPAMVLTSGVAYSVFGLFDLPVFAFRPDWYGAAHTVHAFSGDLIMLLALLHMLGTFKHMMFNDDDLFIRMLIPLKKNK